MKLTLRLLLCALIILHGIVPPALSQDTPDIFNMPDGQMSEPYRANIEKVLREKYGLRLEVGQRTPVFRWVLADGELPPGLILRANGTIIGTPRSPRAEPYRFQVKVVQSNTPGAEPLSLGMSLSVAAQRLKLVRVERPQLVPVRTSDVPSDEGAGALTRRADRSAALFARRDIFSPQAEPPAANGFGPHPEVTRPAPTWGAIVNASAAEEASPGRGKPAPGMALPRPQITPTPPCDISVMPAPSAVPGLGIIYIDARNGNMTENARPVTSGRRFKKEERVRVVVDNKNPYLNTYQFTATATPVTETALNTFVPFVVGDLGDLSQNAAPAPSPPSIASGATDTRIAATPTPTPDPCALAIATTEDLTREVRNAVARKDRIGTDLADQKSKSRRLTDEYNRTRIPLYTPNQTRPDLYRASTSLIRAVHANVGAPGGVDQASLDTIAVTVEDLKRLAARFKTRIAAIREAHPDCLPRIDTRLRWAEDRADEIEAHVGAFERVLGQIQQNLNRVLEGRDAVLKVLCDPHAFFSEYTIGGFETTNEVAIRLEVTPRQGVAEAQAVPGSPFESKFIFGGGPFFSISGGLIFSPLRKREFVRVQGFERDREGNPVLNDDGEPNITTVIGLEENSPTRISPAIFLNGRLKDFNNRFFDGVHMSLGITAKNDNEGTDVEFLIGPSLSMLDRNMFLTVGGYAGRQQKLAGNLFEGMAVPTGVEEIPVEKSYKWNFGFSISYRLPINK